MPEWYFMPVAFGLKQRHHNVFLPTTPRSDMSSSMEEEVQAVERQMKGIKNQYVVTSSGGIEVAVRYLDPRRGNLPNVMGLMVIGSGGLKGDKYDPISPLTGKPMSSRHTSEFNSSVSYDTDGREVLDSSIVRRAIMDPVICKWIDKDMVGRRPITKEEARQDIQVVTNDIIPIEWVIGAHDEFHDIPREVEVARQIFKTDPGILRILAICQP